MTEEPEAITRILKEWSDGDRSAADRLLPLVYDEIRRQAGRMMAQERNGHTLQPTALVHEAFLRLEKQSGIDWRDRGHFYGIMSRLMREVLIDHARRHASLKRGANPVRLPIDDAQLPAAERANSLIALDDALAMLERLDERQAKIVEMRFFGGMTNAEIADVFGVTERTVERNWRTARLWLHKQLRS